MRNVIIGGGAAGIFAAIRCKERNPSSEVFLLEKTNQLLAKVRISGGGRCNVTHACFDPVLLIKNYPRGSKELLGPFYSFQPKDIIAWFSDRGVELKTELDGRMFPTTDSSQTILDCLQKTALQTGVIVKKQQSIESIQKTEQKFLIHLKEESIFADHLLLATGSSPWGHTVSKQFGHTIIPPVPSLFTFNLPRSPLLDLSGISVPNTQLTLKELKRTQKGPLLLTHWGVSGPAVLKLSAWAARELFDLNYQATLIVNWTEFQNEEALFSYLLNKKQQTPNQKIPPLLPNNLLSRLLSSISIDSITPLGRLSHKALLQIAKKLTQDCYQIEGKTTYKQEFVTAGGVHLAEIDFKTMESKITPGLFFAGEILNIDGITGGFNFQNAWTTGWLAGTAMSKVDSGK